MAHIILGKGPKGAARLDVDVLLRTRLLIQANSGGGKSWLLRRLAEQLFGTVPIVIIDPEGEFASLRERLDFVLVGKGGDTPADVRSAGLVARKLLELGASAVCDLYEMRNEERHLWVAAFLEALIDAPKMLWRSMVVMIDEAHIFAPEKGAGESPATEALLSLATRGRKRGYCPILATQRLGKLRKDAAAELQNVLIGQTFIDIDRDRAADALGIPRARRASFYDEIKTMPSGRFFGFGRALTTEPTLIRVGPVQTTHPEAGTSPRSAEPPPAPAAIRHLLPQLADLPRVAEIEARTVSELQVEVARLRTEVVSLRARPLPAPRIERVEVIPSKVTDGLMGAEVALNSVLTTLRTLRTPPPAAPRATRVDVPNPSNGVPRRPAAATVILGREGNPKAPQFPRGARDILSILAAHNPEPLTRQQISTRAIMAPKGSTLRTYLGNLAAAGLIRRNGDVFAITEAGLTIVGPRTPSALPARELIALWREKLTGKAKDMLELLAAEGRPLVKADIGARLGLDAGGSTFRTYLGHLRTYGLVRKTVGGFVVTPELVL